MKQKLFFFKHIDPVSSQPFTEYLVVGLDQRLVLIYPTLFANARCEFLMSVKFYLGLRAYALVSLSQRTDLSYNSC